MKKTIQVKLEETKCCLRRKSRLQPRVGVILGSGLGGLAEYVNAEAEYAFDELPHFPVPTVSGHSGKLVLGRFGNKPVVLMQGRLHYYEGYSMEDVIYPVRLMKTLGVEYLVITAAAGGINPALKTGDIAIIKDHINLMGANCLRGDHFAGFGERFPDMTAVYPKDLRALALRLARKSGLHAREGIYAGLPGPSYETPAEVRAFRKLGADLVGMSVVPEATAAHQMGIRVLAISHIANAAAGASDKPLCHADVIAEGQSVSRALGALVAGIIDALP